MRRYGKDCRPVILSPEITNPNADDHCVPNSGSPAFHTVPASANPVIPNRRFSGKATISARHSKVPAMRFKPNRLLSGIPRTPLSLSNVKFDIMSD